MKRLFTSLIVCLTITTMSWSQDTLSCNPDTSFINSGTIVDPAPYINDTIGDVLPDACINEPYDLTIFLHPPATFSTSGLEVPVIWFRIDSVLNLPEGITYSCSTGDCIFPADSISCMFLSGTPTSANTEEVYALEIALTVNVGLQFPVTFPDPTLAPGTYEIVVHPEGDPACGTVPVLDVQATPDWITLFPNPAAEQLTVEVRNGLTPIKNIQIWDQSGSLIKEVPTEQWTGTRQINLQDLPSGFYITTIRTADQIYRSKFIKN